MPDVTTLTYSSPAQASQAMVKFLSTSPEGKSILSAGAYPERYFPSSESLGLSSVLGQNVIFPFKDNSIGLTDIEVPTTILILNEKNQIQYQTNKFILQSIVKPLQERFQIIETFGAPSLYFYDKRTRVYTLQGILFDGEAPDQLNNPGGPGKANALRAANYWATAFQDYYETNLRGTVLAQRGWIAAIYVNNWYIKGYPLQLTMTKSSESLPQTVGFQMTWAIKDETLISSSAAKSLWSKSKLSPATIVAYNAYLGALDTYQKAYNTYSNANANPAITPATLESLLNNRDTAEQACAKALRNVELAMAVDAKAAQTGK